MKVLTILPFLTFGALVLSTPTPASLVSRACRTLGAPCGPETSPCCDNLACQGPFTDKKEDRAHCAPPVPIPSGVVKPIALPYLNCTQSTIKITPGGKELISIEFDGNKLIPLKFRLETDPPEDKGRIEGFLSPNMNEEQKALLKVVLRICKLILVKNPNK